MLTTEEAFRKFRSRLELNDREQADATRRHNEVRMFIRGEFEVDNDFLTGSYRRWTKTKPLKDIDIFFVLGSAEAGYRKKHPSAVIDAFFSALAKEYGEGALKKQARSVNIDFGIRPDAEDKTGYQVLSIDAVPAFAVDDDFEIPDTKTGSWIKTNPKVHAEKATTAHQVYSSEWKGIVRMAKYWNNNPRHGERPVKPSFLLEVMALECVHGIWGGRFDYEMQALFSTLADRIGETWADPAGLGPPVSAGMDAARKARARELLLAASRDATGAIDLARRGRNGEALQAWRKLFGPRFPLS